MNQSYHSKFCGTSEYMKQAMSKNLTWKQQIDKTNQKWINHRKTSRATSAPLIPIIPQRIEISIVWHALIGEDDISNYVTDECIAYQIDVLNRDFNGRNPHFINGTPAEFEYVACKECNITFRLDSVIRKIYDLYFSVPSDHIKKTEFGGSDPVEPAKKLNIWTGPIAFENTNGVELSYATSPIAPLDIDGIVLNSKTLCPMMGQSRYSGGRDGTHQVGHYFGLEHIFGDHDHCNNSIVYSDFIEDTPMQLGPTLDCPYRTGGAKTCDTNPYSQDMYMNFMDHTYDPCRVLFTNGQCSRMWWMIAGFRTGLLPNWNGRQVVVDKSFVSWIYFRRFDLSSNTKYVEHDICFGDDDILFYDDSLNKGSSSNISIYGCLQKTTNVRISHMMDIQIVYGEKAVCNDGYVQSSQDLNEGNVGGSVYLCYSKEDSVSDDDNMAILDIALIETHKSSEFNTNNGWIVNREDDINPNGISLSFAVKKGKYLSADNDNEQMISYLEVALILCLSVLIFGIICVVIKRHKVSKLRREVTLTADLEYGAAN